MLYNIESLIELASIPNEKIGLLKQKLSIKTSHLAWFWMSMNFHRVFSLALEKQNKKLYPFKCIPVSPYAEISWLLDSGEGKWWECRFLLVARCSNLMMSPHFTASLKQQKILQLKFNDFFKAFVMWARYDTYNTAYNINIIQCC